jgi:hypothetical protein
VLLGFEIAMIIDYTMADFEYSGVNDNAVTTEKSAVHSTEVSLTPLYMAIGDFIVEYLY